jgi:DNA-binding transcriptional MerR regulator
MKALKTHDLTKQTGLKRETLRFYEEQGLLPEPPRSSGGYRLYPPETVQRLGFIRQAQRVGFTLREIGELMSLYEQGVECGELKSRADRKIDEISEKIEALQAMRQVLTDFRSACDCDDHAACETAIDGFFVGGCCEIKKGGSE